MNELTEVKKSSPTLTFEGWTALKDQAATLIKSGFLPPTINTPEKCIAVAMTGRELGIGLMESLRGINVIQGKPTISPQLMLALARRTGELEDFSITSDKDKAVVKIKRKGQSEYRGEFGLKEATALGLIGKDNYLKQAEVMYRWRAIAAGLRLIFPDAISGLYTPEEINPDVKISTENEMAIESVPQVYEEPELQPKAVPGPDETWVKDSIWYIREKLLEINGGDENAANDNLKLLTIYTPKNKPDEQKWVELKDLEGIGQRRPQWIKGIKKKVEELKFANAVQS